MMDEQSLNYEEKDRKILRDAWGKYELHKDKIDEFINKSEDVARMLIRLKRNPLPHLSLIKKGATDIKDKSLELLRLLEKYSDSVVEDIDSINTIGEEYDISGCFSDDDSGYYERSRLIKYLLSDMMNRCQLILDDTKPEKGRDIKVTSSCVYLLAISYESIFHKQPKIGKTTNFYLFSKCLGKIVKCEIGDKAIKAGVESFIRDHCV